LTPQELEDFERRKKHFDLTQILRNKEYIDI
jgi:TBC1 domain family member 20